MVLIEPSATQRDAPPRNPRISPVCRTVLDILELGRATPQPADCSPSELAAWCRSNKFPLLGFPHGLPDWLLDDPTCAAALESERAWYTTQRNEYARAHDAWLERGVPCLMIKSAGNAPSFPHTSDNIDILFRPEHGVAARDTLRKLGYVELRNIEEPGKFLFRKFVNGACVSAIHVHEWIAWFVGFLDDDLVWERARVSEDDPLVLIPAPEDAILINLAHACYENKVFRFNDMFRVRHALATAEQDLDWESMTRVAGSRGWNDGLAFMLLVQAAAETALFGSTTIPEERLEALETVVRADEPVRQRLNEISAAGIDDLPLNLSYRFCKRLYYRKILADSERQPIGRARDAWTTLLWGVKLKSGVRPQRGMIVSISGTDGSGKTAHARALEEALALSEIRSNYVWSRAGSTGPTGVIRQIGKRLVAAPKRANTSRPGAGVAGDAIARRQQRLGSPVARFAWSWLTATDQVVNDLGRVRVPAWRGRVVVTDRCAFDTAVEMDASLPRDARWSRMAINVMLRIAARPTLGFVLDVSLDTARQRKPEEVWHSSFERERERYRELAERFGLRVISTEGPFGESNDELIRAVITAFMHRYETRLNGLFLANPRQKNAPDAIWMERGTV